MITRETDHSSTKSDDNNTTKLAASSSSTTTSWSRLKDPRIVRVSRAFGGKDRHSKVCTVRGLRDRRVRLSVPTAIQLYDLQDRLGLSQPSKVVDWLLNAAKDEIDELPPLQIPPGAFVNNNPGLLAMLNSQSDKQGLKIGEGKSSIPSSQGIASDHSWDRNEGESRFDLENQEGYVCSESFPGSRQNPSSLSSLMNSFTPSYNSFVRWDPSSLTLSHPPRSHGLMSPEDWHNFCLQPTVSSSSSAPSHHQVLVYQPGMSTQPYFLPSQISGSNAEIDSKQLHFQSAHDESDATQSVRPVHFNMTANLLPSQNNEGR